MRFEFLTAALLKVPVVWKVPPRRLVDDVYVWQERDAFVFKVKQPSKNFDW
jgi:hypothetical protein